VTKSRDKILYRFLEHHQCPLNPQSLPKDPLRHRMRTKRRWAFATAKQAPGASDSAERPNEHASTRCPSPPDLAPVSAPKLVFETVSMANRPSDAATILYLKHLLRENKSSNMSLTCQGRSSVLHMRKCTAPVCLKSRSCLLRPLRMFVF